MLEIPTPGKLRLEDHEFEANLGHYSKNLSPKKKKEVVDNRGILRPYPLF